MQRSLLQWRRQITMVLTISFCAVVSLIFVLLITTGLSGAITSIWFWSSLCLLSLLLFLHFTFRSFLSGLRNDIVALISKALSHNEQIKHSEFRNRILSLVDLERLSDAIESIAEKATKDISELKRLEQVRSEFLGNVSHELRTPIFSIQGYLETLIDGAIDDPEVRDEFLEKAHNNMLRLHSLLNDLIEVSRIESGAMKMSFRYFDLLALATGVVSAMESTANMAEITFYLEAKGKDRDGKIMALGDRKHIEQALVNLVDNAIKYNRRGGEVRVALASIDSTVHVSVSDTGIGIPPEHLNRIFERFYRVDKGRSRDVGGSGLGLAIVKHIIEAHGSQIAVQSLPETGTSFNFALSRD